MTRARTLTVRLIAIVVLMVAITAAVIATATTLAVRANLDQQLNSDVSDALQRTLHTPAQGPPRDPGRDDILGQGLGTVTAVLPDEGTADGMVLDEKDGRNFAASVALTAAQLDALADRV